MTISFLVLYLKCPTVQASRQSTVLSVLVGESNGIFRDLCPIRVNAEETAPFVVSRAR
jgi:hypothetical protein